MTEKVAGAVSDPDVPVMVTVYVPAGVPPPGGVVELLPLLQLVMKTKPAISKQISMIPSSCFRRELKPAPSKVTPPIGSNKA